MGFADVSSSPSPRALTISHNDDEPFETFRFVGPGKMEHRPWEPLARGNGCDNLMRGSSWLTLVLSL